MKKYLHIIIIILLLFLTVALRLYRWEEKFSFNAEYNYKLWPMEKLITERKPTLIGIEAVSYLHHIHYPPLFLYLFSPILRLSNFNPTSIELVLILLSSVTAYIFFLLGNEFRNRDTGYLLTFLYAVSFLAQRSDRFIWVVGPVIGITALFLLLLLQSLKKKHISPVEGFILGSIVGVGLNFHYQVMIIPMAFFMMAPFRVFREKLSWKVALLFVLGITIFLSPLIIFDLRHNWYNLTGIRLLLSYAAGDFVITRQMLSAFHAYASMFLGVFIPPNNPAALVSQSLILTATTTFLIHILFLFFVRLEHKEENKLLLQFCYILGIIGFIIFVLIRNNFNYYLVILQPTFLLLLTQVFLFFFRKKLLRIIPGTLFLIFIAVNIVQSITFVYDSSWNHQKQAIDFILQNNKQMPLSIHFEQSASEEYLFLLYYRAKMHGIDFIKIEYYEPWQDGSRAEFVVQPKTKDGKLMYFGNIAILQKN